MRPQYFFVRNVIQGNGEASIKFNTAAGPISSITVPAIRNLFFYHNTIARTNTGTVINLWYAVANDHNVPIKNVVFRNNVIWAMQGGKMTDANTAGVEQPSFDYNLWYTQTTGSTIFEWWDGNQTLGAQTFDEFRQISAQETNGVFGDPGLDSNLAPMPGPGASLAVDNGVPIPGINDGFSGTAPDLGAFELATTPPANAGSLQFSQANLLANEPDGTFSVFVSRVGGSSGAVSVSFNASGGTASAGTDYTLSSSTINWADGDAANKSFTVTLVNDTVVESQETVVFSLSSPTNGAVLGLPATVTLQINDDDTTTGNPGSTSSSSGGGAMGPWILFALLLLGRRTRCKA